MSPGSRGPGPGNLKRGQGLIIRDLGPELEILNFGIWDWDSDSDLLHAEFQDSTIRDCPGDIPLLANNS